MMESKQKIQTATVQSEEIIFKNETITRYECAVNYLSSAQIFLKSNPLLREAILR
jgi:phosphoketolase